MQCFLTASQHVSGKRIPTDIKNILMCQLMAWGIKILASFSFLFFFYISLLSASLNQSAWIAASPPVAVSSTAADFVAAL